MTESGGWQVNDACRAASGVENNSLDVRFYRVATHRAPIHLTGVQGAAGAAFEVAAAQHTSATNILSERCSQPGALSAKNPGGGIDRAGIPSYPVTESCKALLPRQHSVTGYSIEHSLPNPKANRKATHQAASGKHSLCAEEQRCC